MQQLAATQFSDAELAAIGRRLIEAIQDHADATWAPVDCPSEIVRDLKSALEASKADTERLRSELASVSVALKEAIDNRTIVIVC